MSLLLPLGLIGLAGVLVLIFIYLIKPNYQQKFVSSTYVWKLSLKYRKKRLPVSRLRNILIFLCQLLALTAFGLLLAQPVIPQETTTPKNEKIAIIDASASMLVTSDGESRFERAVKQVKDLAETTLAGEDGAISVIVADSDAYLLISRATAENLDDVRSQLNALTDGNTACGFGSADLDGAAKLAEEILSHNSESEVVLFTGTEYIDKGAFTVVDVSGEDDWNVAVLDCKPTLLDTNNYSFSVEIGCFGRSKSVSVVCELYGVNKKTDKDGKVTSPGKNLTAVRTEYFSDAMPEKTLIFTTADFEGNGDPIVSFEYMYVHVDEADSFERDNTYNVYGGEKPVLRIQYASTKPNNYFAGILRTLRETEKNLYNIELREVAPASAASEGYDLYIYEHQMPEILPTDGVVLLIDPDKAPEGSGLRLGDSITVASDSTLASGQAHPIIANMDPNRITVAKYRKILSSDGYEELMYYHGDPVILVREDAREKVIVLALDLNYSSLGVVVDFPMLIHNIYDHFLPATLKGNAFEVGDTVKINARGDGLTLDGPGFSKTTLETLPATVTVNQPGDYTLTQINMRGEAQVEQFFVHIPKEQSDLSRRVDELPLLRSETTTVGVNYDLLLWIAAAALLLLCLEWWLHARENRQ